MVVYVDVGMELLPAIMQLRLYNESLKARFEMLLNVCWLAYWGWGMGGQLHKTSLQIFCQSVCSFSIDKELPSEMHFAKPKL